MRTNTLEDTWLLPSRQADHPTRAVLPESRLHGRREGTFLVLAMIALFATIALPLVGTARVIDLGRVLGLVAPDLEPVVPMHLPLGAMVVPLALIALALVGELYGRRRAMALIWVGLVASVGAIGLALATDLFGEVDSAFGPALGLAACSFSAQLITVLVFGAMQRRAGGHRLWLRAIVAPAIALVVGWAAFGFAWSAYATGSVEPATASITAMAIGALVYTAACAVVAVIPTVIAARVLARYLRVSRFAAVDDHDDEAVVHVRPRAPALQPFNSAEMRFFTEGDELAESAWSAPS